MVGWLGSRAGVVGCRVRNGGGAALECGGFPFQPWLLSKNNYLVLRPFGVPLRVIYNHKTSWLQKKTRR